MRTSTMVWSAALLATMLAIPAIAQPRSPDLMGVDAARTALTQKKRIPIIAELARGDPSAAMTRAQVESAAASLARSMATVGVTSVRTIGSLPLVALQVDAAQLDALLASGAVTSVAVDTGAHVQLPESVPLVHAPEAWAAGADGTGRAVAVIDTGVKSAHEFLAGKVVRSVCASPACGTSVIDQPGAGEPCDGDTCYHGTHVAGIVAGSNSSFSGVAPKASIISVRVFDYGSTPWENVLRGLDYVRTTLAPAYDIAAVNMSLGGGLYSSDCDTSDTIAAAFATEIDALKANGVATVVSSGNSGSSSSISLPACIHNAVSVGSTTKADGISSYSNSAAMLDLLAPGESIYSAYSYGGYITLSGTSMAAPHVAGAFAALASDVDATVDEIEAALEGTGTGILDTRNGLTRPRIDVAAALDALGGGGPSWKAWETLATPAVGRPYCKTAGSGQIDCFVNTADKRLVWSRLSGGTWRAWTSLGGALDSTASCVARGTKLNCFVIGTNKRLMQDVYDGTRWSGWTARTGATLSTARPSCVSWGSAGIRCFVVSTGNALQQVVYDGKSWKSATSLGGTLKGRPACLERSGGLDCFALLATGKIGWRRFNGSSWAAWKNVGSITLATSPSCVVRGSVLHCFAPRSGSGGTALMATKLSGGAWSSWSNLGGTVMDQPSCLAFGDTGIECFAETATHGLWRKSYDGAKWAAGQDLGGSIAAKPVCVSAAASKMDCFAAGLDGMLKRISYY